MLLLLAALLLALPAAQAGARAKKTRAVLYVGNNWDGTADVVQPRRFKRIARINIIPDIAERMAEIRSNPERQGYFLAIRELVGEGHDQFVDDMFSSHNGRVLYVSRPSLADVVAINLRTRKIIWRTKVDGNRADHMAISPDGRHVLVSASTAKVVDVIDTKTGQIVARIPSGDQPYENNFSKDGKLVYHASIGTVYTPLDDPAFDSTALSPDERYVYFQVSFFHGFVEYDLQQDRVLRLAHLPISDETKSKRRDEYLLDSAHHGLAMNGSGTKLCAAGTMSDYAAIVDRSSFAYKIAAHGTKPYWATNKGRGTYCFVSFSGDDAVSVISYRKAKEIARIQVGDHPQRMRMGKARAGLLGTKKPKRPR